MGRLLWLTAVVALAAPATVRAQYSLINTPLQTGGSSFYEGINLGWGVAGNGWGFNWNGGNANPPFGGFVPGQGANVGGAFGGRGLRGGFQLNAAQGADTTLGTQSGSVTVMNGGQGFFADQTIRPFVTGFIPVVGNGGGGVYTASPLADKVARYQALRGAAEKESRQESPLERPAPQPVVVEAPSRGSSAERGAPSLAEIRAAQANPHAAEERELAEILAKAADAEAKGQTVTARILYQQAQRRAVGDAKAEIGAKLQALSAGAKR